MLAMAHELIDDQVIEISKLTHKVNQLQQKLSRTVKYKDVLLPVMKRLEDK